MPQQQMAFATPSLLGQVAYPGQQMMAPMGTLPGMSMSQPGIQQFSAHQQMAEMQAKMQLLQQ